MTNTEHDGVSLQLASLRAVALLCGSIGFSLLSAWAWLLSHENGQFVLKHGNLHDTRIVTTLPNVLVYAAIVGATIGSAAIAAAVVQDARLRGALKWALGWMRRHVFLSALLLLTVAVGSLDIYELVYDPYAMRHRFGPWMLRQDLRSYLQLAAAVCAGLALSALWASPQQLARGAARVRRGLRGRVLLLIAFVAPLLLGAAMSRLVLDGIAHFSDALTYLIQGRMMWAGMMYMPAPADVELFKGSLFFVETGGRFFGKYPLGWPAVLGTFDHFGVGFLANAVLVGTAAVLTGLVARQFAPRRVAVLAALLIGLSPWTWFNGANFASHVASTCAVTGFMWLFLRTMRRQEALSALGAGLFLGVGVVVRPGDAAMFALPPIFVVLGQMVRRPQRWTLLGPLIAIAAMAGVAAYLWQNAVTTGSALQSPYALEPRWGNDWHRSALDVFGRFTFQWVELNQHFPGWGLGGLTAALLGAIAAGHHWRQPGLRLLATSTLLFFIANTAFGFTTVWWGPRWLLPATPLVAILAAELIDVALRAASDASQRARAAAGQAAVCLLIGGLVAAILGVYPAQVYLNRIAPPHLVSAAAHDAVKRAGLTHAIVAMPPRGTYPPVDARAGMVFMQAPFESNNVIYVRSIEGWPKHADKSFPGRDLYEIVPDPAALGSFHIKHVPQISP